MQTGSMQDFMIRISRQVNYMIPNMESESALQREPGKIIICMSTYCPSSSAALEEAISYMGDADDFQVSISPGPPRLEYETLMRGLAAPPAHWGQTSTQLINAIDTHTGFSLEQELADQPLLCTPVAASTPLSGQFVNAANTPPENTSGKQAVSEKMAGTAQALRATFGRWRDAFRNKH